MKKFFSSTWAVAVALLAICILSYGLVIPTTGLYMDEWYELWFAKMYGPLEFIRFFSFDRPFMAGIYILINPLLGQSPLVWHIFGLLCRWLVAFAFYLVIKTIRPSLTRQAGWAAILSAVYPGFKQQLISEIYSHNFLLFIIYLLSVLCIIQAIRNPHRFWLWYIPAWICYTFALISSEYIFGLALIFPLLVWLIGCRPELSGRKRLLQTLQYCAPFLVSLVAYWTWRTFFFTSIQHQLTIISAFSHDPIGSFLYYMLLMAKNVYAAGVAAWLQAIPTRSFFKSGSITLLLYGAVVIGAFLVVWLLLKRNTYHDLSQPGKSQSTAREGRALVLIGLIAMVATDFPMWAANLQVSTVYSSDRFTLPLMFGACLLLVGVLELISLIPHFKSVPLLILAMIVGVSCGANLQTAKTFSAEWAQLKTFLTQLTWRVPAIQPGTTLYTHELPLQYYGEASLSAAIDWIYTPDLVSREMPYYLVYTNGDLIKEILAQPDGGTTLVTLRGENFIASTTQALVMFYEPPACLHIIDPNLDGLLPTLPDDIEPAVPFSKPDLIQTSSPTPAALPAALFGSELPHDWCYYFEEADLARQEGNWQQVAALGDQSAQLGLTPNEASEWLVFSEGYAHIGDWKKAVQYSQSTLNADPLYQPIVCTLWERIGQQTVTGQEQQTALAVINAQAGCSSP
jgi:hypothetical protein